MQEQIIDLQKQIDDIKAMLANTGMPFQLREIIRNEVIKDQDMSTPINAGFTVGAEGDSMLVPPFPNGYLILRWLEKEYHVPFVDPDNILNPNV
jgi:hypothetical protein